MKPVILLMLLLTTGIAQAQEIFIKDQYAIGGYDPVAYFTDGKPVKGTEKFMHSWNGAQWKFSSQEHLDLFKKSPEKYAPQYGGYCAFGMSGGYKAPTEADAFTIHNGKLYLNYNHSVRSEWDPKKEELIIKADKNWPSVKATKP